MMMINNINPHQGLQNAVRPGGSSATSTENRLVLSSGRSKTVLVPEAEAYDAQLLGITERVNNLQQRPDLNLVHDPPFFPIATYQRMDLIGEIRSIQVEIGNSSLSPELKQAGEKIKDDATDQQIANVLDKLLSLRDTLSRKMAVSKDNIQPGSILKLEV
ncbi:hypothetical protein EG834_04525 [bacterium]|nr:hypothetical protein [bacterium]